MTRRRKLPPDPEGENDKRASWADVVVEAFQRVTGSDKDSAVSDLICDLRHWCDRNDIDFDAELTRAQRHYHVETLSKRDYVTWWKTNPPPDQLP